MILLYITNKPWYERSHVSPRYATTYVHGSDVDYYTYLATIRESKDGSWLIPAQYTTEKTNSSYIYLFYIVLGKIAWYFNESPITIYHGSRFVLMFWFIVLLYSMVSKLTEKTLVFTSVLVGIFSTVPYACFDFLFTQRIIIYDAIRVWWHNIDPLYRFDYIPHHIFSINLTLFVLIMFMKLRKTFSYFWCLLIIMCVFFAAFIFPVPVFICTAGISLASAYWIIVQVFIRKRETIHSFRNISICIVLMDFAFLLATSLIKLETAKGFPWNQWVVWDVLIWNRVYDLPKNFIIGSGPAFFVGLPMIIQYIVKPRSFRDVFLAIWAILPLLLYPLFLLANIAVIRIVFLASFIPVGIIAVDTIHFLTKKIVNKNFQYLIRISSLVVFLFISLQTTKVFYKEKLQFYSYDAPHIKIPKSVYDALLYIQSQPLQHARFLSTGAVGLALPAFGSVISYFGHPVHTQYYETKMNQVIYFFSGKYTSSEIYDFLSTNQIDYVFYGPKEKSYGSFAWHEAIQSTIWYENSEVTIYKVGLGL